MGNIVLLDELTINKIAAGEVIERPASVIKEMLENSIDAGATNIVVEIRNGGISYIRITDNGKGIAEDDMEIAFERHATSKIRSADDLNTVTSMGFRGEALASVAAIANVEMMSKTENDTTGHKIVIESGKVLKQEEVGCPKGTTITVQNLFFNTPVRYKFLKKDYTESGYIEDVVARIALVHPEISIKFVNTGKTIFQTSGNGDIKNVVYGLYGKDVAEEIIVTSFDYEDMHVTGVVGKPEISRSNRANQIFFVNKRFVKDKTLSAAVAEAFKGLIPAGKFGFVVLNLDMNPSQVDVNVHPAKLEVRFEDENKVFKAMYHAVKNALTKGNIVNGENNDITKEKPITQVETLQMPSYVMNMKKNESTGKSEPVVRKTAENILEEIYKERQAREEQKNKIEIAKKEEVKAENIVEEKPQVQESNEVKAEENDSNTLNVLEKLKQMKNQMLKEMGKGTESSNETKKETEPKIESKPDFEYKISENPLNSINEKINEMKAEYNLNIPDIKTDVDTNIDNNLKENDINTKLEVDNVEIPVALKKQEKQLEQYRQKEAKEHEENEKQEEPKNNENLLSFEAELDKKVIPLGPINEAKEFEYNQNFDENESKEKIPNFDEMYLKMFGKKPMEENTQGDNTQEEAENLKETENKVESATDIINENISMLDETEEVNKLTYKYIGVAFDTYVIFEIDKELYILDQLAAKERILYDKLNKNYYEEVNKDSQMLLLPDVIQLTYKQMSIAMENIEMFENAGFTIEEFGENTIRLSGVPEMCESLNTKDLFIEILDEINTVPMTEKDKVKEKFLSAVAHRVALREQTELTQQEIETMMDELLDLKNPFKGIFEKSIVIKMEKYDIERKFARK